MPGGSYRSSRIGAIGLLEGKGRPTGRRSRRTGPAPYRSNTSDSRGVFFRFGPPENPKSSKYLNFMRMMEDTGRGLTYYDLHQLCTGLLREETVIPNKERHHHIYIDVEYSKSVGLLLRYGYIRKLAYGRNLNRGRGRPNSVFAITEKGRQSLRRFRGRYTMSPYYDDTYRRIMEEKKALYSGRLPPPFKRTVEPGMKVFNQFWIWDNMDLATSLGVKTKNWR